MKSCTAIILWLSLLSIPSCKDKVPRSNDFALMLFVQDRDKVSYAQLGFSAPIYSDALEAAILEKIAIPSTGKDGMIGIAARCREVHANARDDTKLIGTIEDFLSSSESAVRILRDLGWNCEPVDLVGFGMKNAASPASLWLVEKGRSVSFDLFRGDLPPSEGRHSFVCTSPNTNSFGRYGVFTKSERWVWWLN